MPDGDLRTTNFRTLIEGMDAATLNMFKEELRQQLPNLDPITQRSVFTRLQGIPQLADITPKTPESAWWNKARQLPQKASESFAALAAAPFTPPTLGDQNLPWWQREQQQYKQWKAPSVDTGLNYPSWLGGGDVTLGVKGALETLPWFAIPSGAGVYAKLGSLGAKAGALGAAARVTAGIIKPAAVAEKILAYPISKPMEKLAQILKVSRADISVTKVLRSEELSKRVGKASGILAKGEGEEAFIAARGALKGKMPVAMKILPREQLQPAEFKEIFETVRTSTLRTLDKMKAEEGLQKLLIGDVPQEGEIKLLEKVFGKDTITKVLNSKKSLGSNAFEQVLDASGAVKSGLSAFDLSGLLRQGGILATRHPLETAKIVKPMLSAFLSDKNAGVVDQIIRSRKNFNLSQSEQFAEKLYIAPLGEGALVAKEEAFMSNMVHKIPILGGIIKASERAYITVLNDMRSRVWELNVINWERIGAKVTQNDYQELIRFINRATGRGNLGKLGGAKTAPLLNNILFSPKLVMSRIQLPTLLFSKSALVRKEAWQTLTTFLAAGTSLLALLDLSDVGSVGWKDPRSADFGKVKIGNTRLDFWTGYTQYARFLTQLVTAQRTTENGNITELNRKEVVDRFFQSKLAPLAGLMNDILAGQTYMGETMELDTKSLSKQAWSRLAPLFIQDMADAINQEGPLGGFIAAPGMFGVGVVTYTNEADKIRNKLAMQLGKSWDELDREQQLTLERSSPELQKAIDEREKQTADTKTIDYYDYGKLVEKSYQGSILQAVAKYKSNGDGGQFKDNMNLISKTRSAMYAARDSDTKFADIVERNNQPLTADKLKTMPENDVARQLYYDMMYSDDMYDQFGDYRFDEADKRKQAFLNRWGQDKLDYIERVMGLGWDEPQELKDLRDARKVLQPYWDIQDQVLSQYPPEYKDVLNQINILEKTDPMKARQLQWQYPGILMARKRIAMLRQQMKLRNPTIRQLINTYYTY